MEPTAEVLQEVEDLAYCYMQRDQIVIITDCELDFGNDKVELAFQKGRLKRKAKFNMKIITLSDQLSSPAMTIESKIAEETFLRDEL